MRDEYRIVIEGRSILREIELSADTMTYYVGTTQRCDARFRKELFFSPFEISFTYEGDAWAVSCSSEVYFGGDGVQKLMVRKLAHGDELTVKYAKTNAQLFVLRFFINFERDRGFYDRAISLEDAGTLTIGGMTHCNICLKGPYTEGDLVVLQKTSSGYSLSEQASRYGVLVDGWKLQGTCELKDKTFFSVANYYFYFEGGSLFFSRDANAQLNDVTFKDIERLTKSTPYPLFNRNTRVRSQINEEPIPVLTPPQKPQKPRTNVVIQLMPAIGMLAVTLLLRGTLMSSGNMSFVLISAASISVGILASVAGIVTERRRYKKELEERDSVYASYIEGKREEVAQARAEELAILEKAHIPQEEELRLVQKFSPDLFDRVPSDEDYLAVRVGTGLCKARRPIDYTVQERLDPDELADLPEKMQKEFKFIENAPVILPLTYMNAVGVVGQPYARHMLLKDIVVDVCTRQYAHDVQLFCVADPRNEDLVRIFKELPHVQNSALNRRNIVCDDESKAVVFEYLFKVLSTRAATKDRGEEPWVVVLVLDDMGLRSHPLSRFVGRGKELSATFVFFNDAKKDLPLDCDAIVEVSNDKEGRIVNALDGVRVQEFVFPEVPDASVRNMARVLAPVRCQEVSLEGGLTKNITLFEMMGILSAEDLNLAQRWECSQVVKTLAAPIGVSTKGLISLDLHDKAHGPHGLVAGTTGSGKSEILQTYILSVASLFHPYEVSFMIIDFKGGGMVNQFINLPHLVGAITNLDDREIDRSLKSLKAELRKRQRLFAQAGVNHISKYITKFKKKEVAEPLPHLIIIVDEFAELRQEQPDFMKELISAARIGRSLGVHLILATQKPAGQVNEQIWSNSRFKLCLKVQSASDSNEVLKSPLAAEIKEPGRAYLQVGNNEIFELLQSAYSGAPEHSEDDAVKEYTLFQVETSGRRIPLYERKKTKASAVLSTQLDAVVEHVASYCDVAGIAKLPSIIMPPLPEQVDFPAQGVWRNGGIALGICDDPDNQYQGEAVFDIDNTNTLILGAAQMGKTNVLQSIIRGIAAGKTPRQAAIYILDFGSMILKSYESLNHVGGVVVPAEDERMKNLFKLLSDELAERRKRLMEVGVSSFSSYEEAGYDDLPHIYLIIDNFAVFRELYAERYDDELQSICRDGIAYGITTVVANSASTGFGYKYRSSFSTYITLSCSDTSEYASVFDRCRMVPKDVPGRALCCMDKKIYEFQNFLSFQGEKEVDRVQAVRAFVEGRNAQVAGMRARAIPSVPADMTLDYINDNYVLEAKDMAFALDYETIEPVRIDLDRQFSLAIVGKEEEHRQVLLSALIAELRCKVFDRPVEIYVIDDLMRGLASLDGDPFVNFYRSDYSVVDEVVDEVEKRASERYRLVSEEGRGVLETCPYLVVIVNSSDALNRLSSDKELYERYAHMAKQYASMRILFVFSCVADESVSYSAPQLLKTLKEERKGFVTASLADQKFFDVNPSTARAFRGSLEEGQALYLSGSTLMKVKIARG